MHASPPRTQGRPRCLRPARWLVLAAPLLLGACHPGVLDPAGAIAGAERTILIDSLAIMLAIVLPTIAATLGFAWWFRAGNTRAHYNPTWSHSGAIELIVWGIPLLTIMLLGGVTWVSSHQLDPAVPIASKNKALEVQVVSLDWKWLFIYPDLGVASVNTLTVPAETPVHFSLTSASVMNSFWVPQLGSQIYTMNNMATQLNLIADKPGTYGGISSHYSGDGFSDMVFDVHAVPADQFASWVTTTKANGPMFDRAAYTELAKQSQKVAPFTYRDIDKTIYYDIVTDKIPPAPGPPAEVLHNQVSNRTAP